MSTQENMALVRRFFQARAEADLDAMDKMMAPGFISHPLFEEPDREGYKRQVAGYVAAFSNVSILIDDQVAARDKVTSRITGRATHDRKELTFVTSYGTEWGYLAALGSTAMIPTLLFILFVQRHLVRGLTLGGLRE